MTKARKRLDRMARLYAQGKLDQEDVKRSLAGWLGYARFADTYNFRRRLFAGFWLRKGSAAGPEGRRRDDSGQQPLAAYRQLPLALEYGHG